MPSTFFGLNIGASALSTFQTSINTTANNISNVQTQGYTRQKTSVESTTALRVTARYGSIGTGVQATEITQERDLYYDIKYRGNNSSLGLYEQKLYYQSQIEDLFKDDSTQNGFSTIFSSMFNALDTLSNNNADESVRNQFINEAQILCTYFNSLSTSLSSLQEDVNEEIKSQVQDVNAISEKIALLNKEINSIEVRGGHANELRDERANLLDDLSKMVSVETTEYEVQNTNGDNLGGTVFTVIINGQVLVDGNDYRTLECVSQDYNNNQNDIDGLYHIVWSDTGMNFAATTTSASGSLKALFETRDGNNNFALGGTITKVTSQTVTIQNPNVTNINALDIAQRGQFTVGNVSYKYDGWSAEVDADGNITSYTFNLKETLDDEFVINGTLNDKYLTCGEAITGMGIPYYQQQMNEFLRNFMQMFNDIERTGEDLDGNPMSSFFTAITATGIEYNFDDWAKDKETGEFVQQTIGNAGTYTIGSDSHAAAHYNTYYMLTASTAAVNTKSIGNPRYFATTKDTVNGTEAADLMDQLKKLQNDVTMFRGDGASAFLETMLSDITVDTQKSQIFFSNYSNLEEAVGKQRMSVSGVDEDEEALNLIKFQNAYNMASKVISVMSEMYDRLINETGV